MSKLFYSQEAALKYLPFIGLEIHAQIVARTKLFSGAVFDDDTHANSSVALFDMAIPGTLPVLNKTALMKGIAAGLMLNCTIPDRCQFVRKHYFYADMPAGYQITQHDYPIAHSDILRIQLEHDSGRTIHDRSNNRLLIDLNRAGVGLLEIVTSPDMTSAVEAYCFIEQLRLALMENKGQFRVDVNVSLGKDNTNMGVRTEIKNLNSLRMVRIAIKNEIARQYKILRAGGSVLNETRTVDCSGETRAMREKGIETDYRFMPEPNLPPVHIKKEWINSCRSVLSKPRYLKYIEDYGIEPQVALQIANENALAAFVEIVLNACENALMAPVLVEWIYLLQTICRNCNKTFPLLQTTFISYFIEAVYLFHIKRLTRLTTFDLLRRYIQTKLDKSPTEIANEENLWRILKRDEVLFVVEKVLHENEDLVRKAQKSRAKRHFTKLRIAVLNECNRRIEADEINECGGAQTADTASGGATTGTNTSDGITAIWMLLPCLLCDLQMDQEQTDHVVHSGFPTNLKLREHLVEYHAKFVARALLAPNVTDKIHFWLLTNIAYYNENVGNNFLHDSLTNTELESSKQISVSQDDDGGFRLNSSSQKRKYSECNDSEAINLQTATKRLANSTIETGFSEVTKTVNNQLNRVEQSENSVSFPNGSKAVRKSVCQVCHVDVCTTARQRHVYQFHLRVPNLFQCSGCDYTNNNSVWEMRKHCTAVHQGNAHPISNEEAHKHDIQNWNQKCFPDWKLKKSPLSRQDMLIQEQKKVILEGGELKKVGRGNIASNASYDEASICDMDIVHESAMRQSAVAAVVDDRTCHLCWEESRYPGRHIAQKHLRKSLYQCPVCEDFGSYESCTVTKHINKIHPEHCDAIPISNLDRYAQEIRELQKKCFPNRPMKLVRPHVGNRPRERHICQICKIQVAQSDRQRHVYHRHLKQQRIFECPLCSFASNYDIHRVKWHIKWMHKEDPNREPYSHENDYKDEIDQLNERCFPGWQHRRKQFWWLDIEAADKQNVRLKKTTGLDGEEKKQSANAVIKPSLIIQQEHQEKPDEWTCMLCKKKFKPSSNFLRHVAKDHLKISLYQCPICKGHGGQDAYEIRSHMQKVHGGCTEEPISNIEDHAEAVQKMYQQCFPGRRLKNLWSEKKVSQDGKCWEGLKVQCRECGQEMKTEDRQIHVYRHHLKEPRLYQCPLCEFSHHACSSDVKAHIKYAHRDNADLAPTANLLKFSKEIAIWNLRCFPGWINRRLPTSALEDFNRCRICDVEVRQTSRHIAEVHLKMSLHQCPLCDYGAAESRLVRRHMKNGHGKREVKGLEPIANVVQHRAAFSEMHDRCFPGRPKRLSNITISDEGRRAKCRQCGATISRKRRLTHLLEKHLKKSIFRCSLCPFESTHDENAVTAHIQDQHSSEDGRIINDLLKYKAEAEAIARSCFLDWQLRI
uniref:C2H2-type domain-containing protein n=1 Tax=Setaria digitata TaxID=48799 RepID=A0A915PRK2_9BILA